MDEVFLGKDQKWSGLELIQSEYANVNMNPPLYKAVWPEGTRLTALLCVNKLHLLEYV